MRHVHQREDEWYYALSRGFVFETGDNKYIMQQGEGIWLPTGVPHLWANTGDSEGKLILAGQPGGFEKFFDELGKVPVGQMNAAKMTEIMATSLAMILRSFLYDVATSALLPNRSAQGSGVFVNLTAQ